MSNTAIAILNYNGKEFLQKFLPTLVNFSKGYPIYIGDNASTDDSVEFIKTKFPKILLIELDANYGYSKGYNLLLKEINSDYVALINSDIEVTPDWLKPLIVELEMNDKVAAIQPKIRSFANKDYFEYAGAAGGFIDKHGYPFCRGRIFDTLEKDDGQYDNPIEVQWASGACFVVRKSAFDLVGGFDDDFFAHMEEIDLCWRLSNNNYTILYSPKCTVHHVGGGTLAYGSPFKTYLNFRNGLYLLLKNLPIQQLRKIMISRIMLDWLSVCYFLAQGKWQQPKAILTAHLDVLKNRKVFIAKREPKAFSTPYTKSYSIVWKYFIKRIKFYNDL